MKSSGLLFCRESNLRFVGQNVRFVEKKREGKTPVTNILHRVYCTPMYACQLWNKYTSVFYNRIRVAHNNAFRILHRILRNVSARNQQVIDGIVTFDALIRKNLFSFVQRFTASSNQCLKAIMQSGCFCKSSYVVRYNSLLYSAEMAE